MTSFLHDISNAIEEEWPSVALSTLAGGGESSSTTLPAPAQNNSDSDTGGSDVGHDSSPIRLQERGGGGGGDGDDQSDEEDEERRRHLVELAKKARLDRLYSSEDEDAKAAARKLSPFKRPPSAAEAAELVRPDSGLQLAGTTEPPEEVEGEKRSDSKSSAADEYELSFEINEAEFR